jgi:hypothetical protein
MPTITPGKDSARSFAERLLAAAEKQGLDPSVVQTTTQGSRLSFSVPESVADAAGFGDVDEPAQHEGQLDEPPKSGKGSGIDAWKAFLRQEGVDFDEDEKDRDSLIEAWDASRPES